MTVSLSEFADRMCETFPVVIREFLRQQTNELCKGRITLPQFIILDSLSKQGDSKMTDLAHFMGVTTAAMTGIVDRLVRYGYAQRTFDPKDRRIIKISLTAKGSALVRKINQQRHNMIISIFGRISQQDRQEYLRIIMQIRDNLIREKETRA